MAVPTVYSETTLANLMAAALGPIAATLAITDYSEAVNDVLLAYGVTDIADATDIPRIRAMARAQAWRLAMDAASSRFDDSTDGQSMSRSQLYDHAKAQYERAEAAAAGYLTTFAVGATPIRYTADPYTERAPA